MRIMLRLLSILLVASLSVTVAAAQATKSYIDRFISAEEPFERHHDTVIRYCACNQDYDQPINPDKIATLRWQATWDGNRFMHTPGPGAEGVAHPDDVLRYLTWDGKCWEARWDAGNNQFIHKRVATGAQHPDKILNYLTWDRTKWTATRDGNEFYHIYVAGAENEVPWEKQVITFFNRMRQWVTVIIEALPT